MEKINMTLEVPRKLAVAVRVKAAEVGKGYGPFVREYLERNLLGVAVGGDGEYHRIGTDGNLLAEVWG